MSDRAIAKFRNSILNQYKLRDEGVIPRLDSLSSEIKEIKGVQQAQIWTLIGILITAVGGFLVAAGRFVIAGKP